MKLKLTDKTEYTATQNACKLCAPLGASLVFKGIQNAVPLLHGSQGCATYIRRYLISHFKEPVDIASSNFSEETAVFGGAANLHLALENLRKQYQPELIGIASTCLSETIGEDVPLILKEYHQAVTPDQALPVIIDVSTPSYSGTHMEGFHATVRQTVTLLAQNGHAGQGHVNILPGMVSPADLRHLKEIVTDFGLSYVMLPDYSETMDGSPWEEYKRSQPGGTTIESIKSMGNAQATLEFGRVLATQKSAGKFLEKQYNVPYHRLGLPIGVHETDTLLDILSAISGRPIPDKYEKERGRLVDSYIDGHKYVSQKRAVVYGEEDLVVGLVSFLNEIGVKPVVCASGGESGFLAQQVQDINPDIKEESVWDGVDFVDITELARQAEPDMLIGSSKGYSVARKLDIPLIRVGFPIHDRFGGARIRHIGYAGTQHLFDRIVNTVLEGRQEETGVGYSYL